MQQQNSIISLRNVGLNYGASHGIFSDVNLSLPAGSFHFLTGPSGAGKSSLIKLMYLGLRSYTGHVSIMGQDISTITADEAATLRQRVGVVFQDFRLLDHLTVIDNVALPLRIRGMTQRKSRHVAQDILNWVGLGDKSDAYPQILSGGEKQRVALARAVIGKPKILLADEPTGSVDDAIAVKLLHLFEELNKLGTTIVFATHNHDLTHLFPHPVIHLQDGCVRLIAPVEDKKVVNYA